MIKLIATTTVSLCVATFGLAQSPGKQKSADDDWASLLTQARSAPVPSGSGYNKKANQVRAEDQQKVGQLKQAAQSARKFYTDYPGDARVPQAKKIEAVSLAKAARPSDADGGAPAFQIAAAYRANTANAPADRFEVAALIERQQYYVQNNGKALAKDAVQHEKAADKLRAEFGDTPEVHAFYLGVINTTDAEAAYRVAQRVLAMPVASHVKVEAQVTIDRHALIGKRLDKKLNDVDGRTIDLGETGRPTIVCVWSPVSTPRALMTLNRYKATVPTNARWIYVAVNSTPSALSFAQAQVPFAGVHCLELPTGIGALSDYLKIGHAPYVYVLDRNGSLVGYGPLEDLPALLKTAG